MKFFVICGENSGDLHLSYLIEEMKKINNDVEFCGVCGEKSENIGVSKLVDINDINIMGFVEVLKKYKYLKKLAFEFIEYIKKNEILNVILVDYGGFNLKFLELLKEKIPEINVYYYIPPKIWIWGKKRIKKLILADHILVIFPWEKDFYEKENVKIKYFGNPFIDKINPREKSGEKILLLPGSRKQELERILPIMLEFVKENNDKLFVCKTVSSDHKLKLENICKNLPNIDITTTNLQELAPTISYAIATSGTVILEIALLEIPTIVLYKTSFLNAFIAKNIIKIQEKIKYISLPNIALKDELFPELLQKDCNISNLKKKSKILLDKKEFINDFKNLRNLLGGNKIIYKYADYILKNWRGNEEEKK